MHLALGLGVELDRDAAAFWLAESRRVRGQLQPAPEVKQHATKLKLWKRLADLGDAASQYNLALALQHGIGVPKDDAQAVFWYRKAAEQGDVDAQRQLGALLLKGRLGGDEEAAR